MSVITNEGNSVVVFSKAGLIIPQPYLVRVYEKGYISTISATIGNSGKNKDLLETTRIFNKIELNDLMAFQESEKGRNILFAFGKFAKDFDQAEVQPFPLFDDKLCCFLFGDLADFSKGNDKSPALNCFSEYVKPKITDIHTLTKCDFNQTLAMLAKETFVRDMRNMLPEGGIVFMLGEGQASPIIITRPPKLLTEGDNHFDWGWTSDTLGYKETEYPAAEEEKEEVKEEKLLKFESTVASDLEKHDEITKEIEETKDPSGRYELYAPPKGASKKHMKAFYRQKGWVTALPNGWERGIAVPALGTDGKPVPFSVEKIKSFDRLEAITTEEGKTIIQEKKDAEDRSAGPTPIHHPPAPDPKTESTIPRLGATSIKTGKDFLNSGMTQKLVDRQSLVLSHDPMSLNEALEKNGPSFFNEMGIDIINTFKWPYETIVAMAKLDAHLIAKLAWSYKNLVMQGYKSDQLFKLMFPESKEAKEKLPAPEPMPKDEDDVPDEKPEPKTGGHRQLKFG